MSQDGESTGGFVIHSLPLSCSLNYEVYANQEEHVDFHYPPAAQVILAGSPPLWIVVLLRIRHSCRDRLSPENTLLL